jgi:hypothetical protein
MLVKIIDQVTDDETINAAWGLYQESFEELRSLAVQRHLMYFDEFVEVMKDPRVAKYLALRDDGTLCGISTYTNDLEAVPLIAPEWFARHRPDHYATKRIWYIGFVAVHPEEQGKRAFVELVEQMYLVASNQNGLVGLDICTYNDEVHHMSRVFRMMIARWAPGMKFNRIDQQSYWLYEFPSAA